MIAIDTERLQIRNFAAGDWQAFQEVILHYQASDSARYEPPWPTSAEAVQGIAAWFAAGDDYLCVCLKATGKVIGYWRLSAGKTQPNGCIIWAMSLTPPPTGRAMQQRLARP